MLEMKVSDRRQVKLLTTSEQACGTVMKFEFWSMVRFFA